MNDIVLICDENYVMPTEVMVQSICYNAEKFGKLYNVYICSWDLTAKSIESFNSLSTDQVKVEVKVIDINTYSERFNLINQNSHVTPTALLKFELANIFSDLDKILYLDSDMVVNGDLEELIKLNLEDNFLAAAFEFWKFQLKVYEYNDKPSIPDFYFNSGVMLINLKKFRSDGIVERLWDCKIKKFNKPKTGKFSLMDQDVFNDVCGKNTVPLPIKFNCNTRFTHDVKVEHINMVFDTKYRQLADIKSDAVILHFVGKEDKPWVYANVACHEIWDYYYSQLGYIPEKLARKRPNRDVEYYIKCIKQSIEVRGFWKTIRYTMEKFI